MSILVVAHDRSLAWLLLAVFVVNLVFARLVTLPRRNWRYGPENALRNDLAAKAASVMQAPTYAVCLVMVDGSKVGARIVDGRYLGTTGRPIRACDVVDVLPDQRLVPVG